MQRLAQGNVRIHRQQQEPSQRKCATLSEYLILSIRCYCMRVPTLGRRATESRPPLSA
jgi:hypothetical protein